MTLLLALAMAASAPLPLTPDQARDIRCIALLAIVANEQERGSGWSDVPELADDGARYAGVVGEAVMDASKRTREQVRDLILDDVKTFQAKPASPSELRPEVDRCVALMKVRAPAPPPPPLPRCAAIMGLAYDAVKAREGMTKNAKDLATLASVLAYRAHVEGKAIGQSEAQVDATIGTERTVAAKVGSARDDDLAACALLAQPDP